MRKINLNIGEEVKIKASVVDYNEGGNGKVKVRIEGFGENKVDCTSKYIWVNFDDIQISE